MAAPPVGAQDSESDSTTSTTLVDGQDEGIIPQPNSGREPDEAGDRGGSLQLLVFVLVLVGIGAIVAMVVRESRRARASVT